MLSIDNQLVVNGLTVFRDHQDERQYYYLPSNKAKLADNGKTLQYAVYTDELIEGTSPDFTKDIERVGGFLTLEVELGPTPSEVESLKSALESEVGGTVKLSQVHLVDGSVKLVMFSKEGRGGAETGAANFSIAGATKPALYGTNNAVFSVRLGGREAQIMYDLLFNGTQTQASVVYELDYLGLMPAYHLEITVDFKATDDFWNHKMNLDGSVEWGEEDNRNRVAASADIDILVRDLMNQGAIVVKEIVYSETGQSTNILGEDPNAIKLVKQLLGPELFTPTAIPNENYRALQDAASQSSSSSSTRAMSDRGDEEDDELEGDPFDPRSLEGIVPNVELRFFGQSSTSTTIIPPSSSFSSSRRSSSSSSAVTSSSSGSGRGSSTLLSSSGRASSASGRSSSGPSSSSGGSSTVGSSSSSSGSTGEPSSPEAVQSPRINVNIGYTLKRRSVTEQIKRKYIFNRVEAKRHQIYPQGALTTEGTEFDPSKQISLTRLGEGPFKTIQIEARSSIDLEEYKIQELIVHIEYGYKGANGDRDNRVHYISLTLNKFEPRKLVDFFVDDYETLVYDYYVEFIHEPNTIIGTRETKITSRVFRDVSERDISVNIRDHSPLIPVEIEPGNLDFSPDRIRSVQVYVAPNSTGNGKHAIFSSQNSSLRKFLIYPAEDSGGTYFAREKFFFQNEDFEIVHEDITSSQLIINSPETQLLNITPTLVDPVDIIRQVLVDIIYTHNSGEEKTGTLNLTPEENRRVFTIRKEEDDPINWRGRPRFVLDSGKILEGDWVTFTIAEPFITLASSGFRGIKVIPLLKENTFNGTIAALDVAIFDPENEEATRSSVILMQGNVEAVLLIEDVAPTQSLLAQVRIFRTNGSIEDREFIVPAGSTTLLMPITDINV